MFADHQLCVAVAAALGTLFPIYTLALGMFWRKMQATYAIHVECERRLNIAESKLIMFEARWEQERTA